MCAVLPPYPTGTDWLAPAHGPLGLDQLLAQLQVDDPFTPPAGVLPEYLYRGQLSRRPPRDWPPQPLPQLNIPVDYYHLEPLLASDYRNLEDYVDQQDGTVSFDHNLLARLEHLRCAITVHCCIAAAQTRHDPDVDTWLDGQTGQWDLLGALGQHSGLPTQYLDWSSSKEVALWMATHTFMDDQFQPGGESVLFRIHVPTLDAVSSSVNHDLHLTGQFALRRLDLRGIPPLLARRPAGQHGWSIVHFEEPLFLMRLIGAGGITAYTFTRPTAAPSWLAAMTAQVKPDDDPIVDELEHVHQNPWHTNLRYAVDAVNVGRPPAHQVQWACCPEMWEAAFNVNWPFAITHP